MKASARREDAASTGAGGASTAQKNSSAFWALSVAILRGFLRDKTSVFFAIVFPLMFLVLFGGLLANQNQSKVELIQVGSVPLVEDLPDQAR
ncbi:MAG: hypothetical protein L0H31_02030, partial [Nocardioidaceae bacterium]|nr:hypothetical protein [Nocardioidaceae bacterium]